MVKKRAVFVLGTRPDLIRASLILRYLKEDKRIRTTFVWSGQHYSYNLKDIFIRELRIPKPDVELDCGGKNDAAIVSRLIAKLYSILVKHKPNAAVFLGDTNTVVSCLAAAQLNIPIVHIEGGMRSYDWRMPEEKHRTLIDHLSDLIYVYLDEYKLQAVKEGINPDNVIVTGNPIVDVLEKFYFANKEEFVKSTDNSFFKKRNIRRGDYYLMTCHRRENVEDKDSLGAILRLVEGLGEKTYFPASYRTQAMIASHGFTLPAKIILVDPVGYREFIILMTNSKGVLTDSGTVVEEACILNIPSVQMRRSTERPQVYDVGASIKFDPSRPQKYPSPMIKRKLKYLSDKSWKHNFGNGQTSRLLVDDLVRRLISDRVRGHALNKETKFSRRSYRSDAIKA